MNTHKLGPAMVRGVKVGEKLPVGICSPRSHEDCLDGGVVVEVLGKGLLHGLCIFDQRKRVRLGRLRDELFDFGKGMWCLNVDALEGCEAVTVGAGGGQLLGQAFSVKGAEIEDEEDEAVFAAIVGQRELRKPARIRQFSDVGDVEGAQSGTYAYWSRARDITSNAVRVWACTLRSLGSTSSSVKKAVMRSLIFAQMVGKERSGSGIKGETRGLSLR